MDQIDLTWNWYALLVLSLEFIESYLLNAASITILHRKLPPTMLISLITNACRWTTLTIVAVISHWNIFCMMGSGLGDFSADTLVTIRWPGFVWKWIENFKPKRTRRQRPDPKAPEGNV